MRVIGLDPGKTGGIAMIHSSLGGAILGTAVYVMPGLSDFIRIMRAIGEGDACHVYLERAQAMPKNGAVGMFHYGQHYGELLGVLAALSIRHEVVRPVDWTRAMHSGTAATEPKKRSLEACQRLFPEVNLLATERSKKPHEGIVDALLIAEWGRRQLMGMANVA